ncbi:hypothetical protein [Polaromonas sp. YR568]|uniref:hypothetical protein n=1 Tax=Polaromonas sp. YR568 TaxID=1855301 RepID=UPI00398BD82C
MTHNILPTAPTDRPGRSLQPARTAVQLALKDELRTFGFNLQRGAHWLLQDLGGSLVKQVEPRNEDGTLHKLHHLIDSTAQATFSTLQVAQQAAAVAVLPDSAYRTLHFELQPLAAYFAQGEAKNPSQLFTDAFYWLLRHALAGKAGTALIARQQAIDEAFWQVLEQHAGLIARAQETGASPRDHAALCAAVLRALLAARPVRDASLPPWAGQPAQQPDTPAALSELFSVIVAIGLAKSGDNPSPDVGERLRLAGQLVTARLPLLEAALQQPDDQQLTAELAFLFRHA